MSSRPAGGAALRLLPCGAEAVLAELATSRDVLALTEALRRHPAPGTVDVVPAARTVLVTVVPGTPLEAVRAHLLALDRAPHAVPAGPETAVDVVYDGADLAAVADLTGLGVEGVVSAHTGTPWTVAFCGFAPGFAYLTGGDPRLAVPRLAQPRTRVPAGAVALAGEYSAIYPSASPGGWQLLGHTALTVWDATRNPPALLRAGMRVRFRAVGP